MITLNECKIDQKGKKFHIEATIKDLRYYDNVYIDSVVIDTNETYSPSGPSDKPVFKKELEGDEKYIDLCITAKEMSLETFDNNMFFVYIMAKGTPAPDTPCGMDNEYILSVVINYRPIYNMIMGYIKELNSECNIPKGFIDMILRMKAFEIALKTGNYPTAIKWWEKFFKNKVSVSYKKGCGCNGTS